MRTMRVLAVLAIPCASSACVGDEVDAPVTGVELIDGFVPDPPTEGEIQLVTPPLRAIAPDTDITLCTYLDYRSPVVQDITYYQGFQSASGGHHAILYSVDTDAPAGTHECTEEDMFSARYLAGTGADSPPLYLPDGVAMRMPVGERLMINTHWINTGSEPIDGQAAFNIAASAPSADVQPANLFTTVATEIDIAAHAGGAARTECTVEKELNFFLLGGHMHEWGTRIKLSFTPVGGEPAVIYQTDWAADDQFDPPMNRYTTEDAFVMKPGDKLTVDCDYLNTTEAALRFPGEMCVGWGYVFPSELEIDCVDGNWPRGD